MYNAGKIIFGLLIFLALVTFPFYNNIGKVSAKPEPKIDTPEIQKLPENERKCVEPKDFMRGEHMQMLNDWRDSVVREDNGIYMSSQGKQFNMSLQNTCMKCHSNKKEFCDKCHNYMAVAPYCWTCHIQPKENKS
ncbi:MAG: sulfate reduction electron transfer complex DsrMKJOP subunit DsrJ [Nitrospirae bacterium]|nr:sulfate reduction electron transfer complex DsrMKJOP subunit DsrJ [Nitrospirota bacterium]